MKTLFIPAKYDGKISLGKEIVEKLPLKIGLAASIQFVDQLGVIKKEIESRKNKSLLKKFKNKKIIIAGQIIGCNVKNAEKIASKVDAFLYIGDGSFHPLAIALKINKPVFQYNPLNKEFKAIDEKQVEDYKKRRKGALLKFLNAENVGILVSTKPGQNYSIEKLESLEKKYPKKKFYTFIADTIDYSQLENFPFIEAWVNTACPRIEEDIKIINIKEIK